MPAVSQVWPMVRQCRRPGRRREAARTIVGRGVQRKKPPLRATVAAASA
ncbi:MAG TPA: hypothetical protein VFZ10_01460 [Geminicoccaceae bacterium]